ncbi:MAG: hypothetical protein AAF725_09030 [Acidobacteriota bacterium]
MSDEPLVVTFPRRLAKIGLGVFTVLFTLFAGWIEHQREVEMPWLAVVMSTGCLLVILACVRELVQPRVLAEISCSGGVTVKRRALPGGEASLSWSEVRDFEYFEKVVDRFLFKVIRLRLKTPVEAPWRLFADEDDVAHLDAFAADPGGEELLARMNAIRDAAMPAGGDEAP